MIKPVENFVKEFKSHALRTARLVRKFEDKDLALRPGEGSMSTAEQIAHICANNNFIRSLLEDEKGPTVEIFQGAKNPATVREAIGMIASAIREVERAGGKTTDTLWSQEIEPFGPGWKAPRSVIAAWMVEHEVHHLGSLHVYARIAGKVPEMLYHPVDESVLTM